MIFAHFACACLLATCLLLAKPVRSTLDTTEGYKTKTGSTSSVTRAITLILAPALIRIEYWDRAGGGRNIVHETFTTNEVRTKKWMRAAQKGLKMSCIHLFGHHNWNKIVFFLKTMVLTRF